MRENCSTALTNVTCIYKGALTWAFLHTLVKGQGCKQYPSKRRRFSSNCECALFTLTGDEKSGVFWSFRENQNHRLLGSTQGKDRWGVIFFRIGGTAPTPTTTIQLKWDINILFSREMQQALPYMWSSQLTLTKLDSAPQRESGKSHLENWAGAPD